MQVVNPVLLACVLADTMSVDINENGRAILVHATNGACQSFNRFGPKREEPLDSIVAFMPPYEWDNSI